MNKFILLIAFFALLSIPAGAIAGLFISKARKRRTAELTIEQLAERAESNGVDLLRMAREFGQLAGTAPTRLEQERYKRWACDLQRCACEHLQCINTINLVAVGSAKPAQVVRHG